MAKKKNTPTRGKLERKLQFAREWCIDKNGTKAATRAGYSAKSAHAQATFLLKDPKVQKLIEEILAENAKTAGLTLEMCMRRLKHIVLFDIRKAYDKDGNLKPISELDDETAAAIMGIEAEELFEGRGEDRERVGTLRKVKWNDPVKAAQDAIRVLGGYEKDNAQVAAAGKTIVIADINDLPLDQKMKALQSLL